jgi:hypothetical protein
MEANRKYLKRARPQNAEPCRIAAIGKLSTEVAYGRRDGGGSIPGVEDVKEGCALVGCYGRKDGVSLERVGKRSR